MKKVAISPAFVNDPEIDLEITEYAGFKNDTVKMSLLFEDEMKKDDRPKLHFKTLREFQEEKSEKE